MGISTIAGENIAQIHNLNPLTIQSVAEGIENQWEYKHVQALPGAMHLGVLSVRIDDALRRGHTNASLVRL